MDRPVREIGSIIELGGTAYRITSVEGTGASAIAYRAEYADALSDGVYHHVFIKELFPLSPHGEIYRDGSGNICCMPEGEELFENLKRRFEEGNRTNLTLLASRPDRVSGNLNSYRAYGTYYSLLSVHGGENLQHLLDQQDVGWTLPEMISVMNKLLDALECFHRSGYLHLDISPDNILLLRYQALLIDYNSIWDTRDTDSREFSFSEKEGYSAPEISLRHFADISPATDLYSVCAVFFRMLAGRPLSERETMGNGLKHCFAQGFAALDAEPESARYKVCQILARGLHTLPRKRYQDISQLRADLALLEQMIAAPKLVAKDSEELYNLVYDNLLESLHQTEAEKKASLRTHQKRQKVLQMVSIILVICLFCTTIAVGRYAITVSGSQNSAGTAYTDDQQQTIDRMISCLEANVGTLCDQIDAQQDVLEKALADDVLAGDAAALEELFSYMDSRLSSAQSLPSVSLSDDLLADLIAINPDFPTEQLATLCSAPDEMNTILTQAFTDLEQMIGVDGTCPDASKREKTLQTYQDYLDAYTAWLFYEFDYVLVALEADDIETILYESQYNSLFTIYYQNTDLSGQNAKTVYAALETADKSLWSAQNAMSTCGYHIEWD